MLKVANSISSNLEVPSGYKCSEIGLIPDEWEVTKLGNLDGVRIQNGLFNEPARKGRGCKLVNVGDLYSSAPIDTSRLELFEATSEELARFGVEHGDIFFTRSSLTPDGIAHCNIVENRDNDALVFDSHIIRLRVDPDVINPFFLFRYCLTRTARNYLITNAKTTTMTTIDQGVIASLPVVLPPLPEQEAIAEALADVDALLAALDKLIAKKRAIKQAAMQQLLTGKTRLPGFTGEWFEKPLGEFAAIRNQKVYPANVEPDTLCVELEHIGQGNGQLMERSAARNSTSSKYRFYCGDVLFGRLRPYLRKYWHAEDDGICTTEIWPLIVDPAQACSGFLFALVQADRFIETASISYGTHMPRADWNVVKNYEVNLPPVNEQVAIVTVLFDMDVEIIALEKRRDKTQQIKQGMMQQLLTGRIRLVNPSENES